MENDFGRFCTLVGVKEDSQKKHGHGVTYAHKTERTLKENWARKAKMNKTKKFRKFEVLN